ncbi:amino acid ABC transporter substrate-binding protein [Natrinema caseinilyticum]|uniref:amino acid ABC transporter substrate-binding protein n=1 Tax=Natrinema caseinilyticum TaxID=2961570 RepID=UPI0020C34562|nr:amino acid ABC transporter substrate-binding protein [Natrinema caseinilyticum]
MTPTITDDPDRRANRRRFLKAAGASGVPGLVGCLASGMDEPPTETEILDSVNDDRERSPAGSTITLGGSMSLSGENSDLGVLYRDAYELTIDRINEAGGVDAGDGTTYALDVVLRDDESDPSRSEAIYRNLVAEEDIDYLLGPYASSVTLPASEVAAEAQRPMVAGGGASQEIYGRGNEWIVSLLPLADTYSNSGIDMAMAQSEPPSSAAVLAGTDLFSRSSTEGARRKLRSAGIDIVVDETFSSETSDLSALLERVQESDADVLVLNAHEEYAIVAAEGMARQNVDVDMAMATVGSLTDSFKERTGPNGDYWYGPSPWATTVDYEDAVFGSTSEFISAVESEYGYDPDYHSAAGSAVVQTFQRAFTRVDELRPEAVRDAVRTVQFECLYGPIQFGDDGVIPRDMVLYQWQPDAGKRIVWPEGVSESDPIYPTPNWNER